MKKIIDAEFEVIDGPPKLERPPFDWRWLPWGIRIGLCLLALAGVVAAELTR